MNKPNDKVKFMVATKYDGQAYNGYSIFLKSKEAYNALMQVGYTDFHEINGIEDVITDETFN